MSDLIKIMIVDDDADLLALAQTKLEKTGRFAVASTQEGSKAVELARIIGPALALLDIEMPGMTGEDVAEALAADEATRDIPILFLSSLVTPEDVAANNGVIGGRQMHSKTTSMGDLIQRIESMIRSGQSTADSRQ